MLYINNLRKVSTLSNNPKKSFRFASNKMQSKNIQKSPKQTKELNIKKFNIYTLVQYINSKIARQAVLPCRLSQLCQPSRKQNREELTTESRYFELTKGNTGSVGEFDSTKVDTEGNLSEIEESVILLTPEERKELHEKMKNGIADNYEGKAYRPGGLLRDSNMLELGIIIRSINDRLHMNRLFTHSYVMERQEFREWKRKTRDNLFVKFIKVVLRQTR